MKKLPIKIIKIFFLIMMIALLIYLGSMLLFYPLEIVGIVHWIIRAVGFAWLSMAIYLIFNFRSFLRALII